VAFVRREARRRLEDLQTALAGTLPQNLLTPLATMLGLSAFLRDEGAAVPPELVCEVAQGIFDGSRRLHQTMEKFVVYADLERLAQALRATPGFVAKHKAQTGSIVSEAALEAARNAERQADLALHVDDLAVRVDAAHLRRLVLELVENAVKYSPKGKPVSVDCRRVDGACRLTVKDNGPGLPAERLEEVAAHSGCRTLDGRGFGLPIAKRIAALCGADMAFAPAPEGGTTVTLALPLRD
jgi:signal transduction histidine kinase